MRRLLRGCECPATRCVLGVDEWAVRPGDSLAAPIVIQAVARGHSSARARGHARLRSVACIGVAQAADVTGLVDHAEVCARVTRLRAAVIGWWRFGIGRAVDRTGRAIMPTRGVGELPAVACGVHLAAHAAAVRAGSRAGSATA
jgi:hypothetical protein